MAAISLFTVVAVGTAIALNETREDAEGEHGSIPKPIVEAEVTSPETVDGTDAVDDTDTGTAEEEPRYISGIEDAEPLHEPGLRNTSALLRSRIDEFAATTAAPSVRNASLRVPRDSKALEFGETPARVDYGGVNRLFTPSCYRMVLNDVVVLGAAATIWSDGSSFTFVNAGQFRTEEQARQYFWAASLFVGIDNGHCSGWPPSGVAVDPVDLSVERDDFRLETTADELITAVDDGLEIEDFTAEVAYETVARIGNTVIVAVTGNLFESSGPEPFIQTLEEALGTFSNK